MYKHERELPRALIVSPLEILVIANRYVRGYREMRIDWGPGYRVYYTMLGRTCVLC